MRPTALLLPILLSLAAPAPASSQAPPAVVLEGRAVLPADTFAPGSPSGDQLPPGQPINGRTPPFAGQPVQGFSAVLPAGDGRYLAMPDNGFGARDNSADFLLRVYRVKPRFETATGASARSRSATSSSCAIPTARSGFRSSTTPWASAC